MPAPVLPLHVNDEQVGVAWIGSIPDIITIGGTSIVATTLPSDVDPVTKQPAAWVRTGFITVAVVGGSPDMYLPVNRPVLQVNCWATVPGSTRPPWGMAAALASAIRYACWPRTGVNRVLAITAGGVTYPPAAVQAASLKTAFRRLYSDAADYAVYQGDLQLDWVTPGDRID